MNEGIGLTDFTGLGLADIELLPQYSRFLAKFERFEERAKEYEASNRCEVIRIDDGQGVFVETEKWLVAPKSTR
jgi:peptidase E